MTLNDRQLFVNLVQQPTVSTPQQTRHPISPNTSLQLCIPPAFRLSRSQREKFYEQRTFFDDRAADIAAADCG
jgi:hypothetical protein